MVRQTNSASSATSERAFRWLVTLSLLGTIVLMGAAVYSVSLRGWMSCGGDFPKCAGVWAPVFHSVDSLSTQYTTAQILAEWYHRVTAFVTGILMLVATGLAWWRVEGYPFTTWTVTSATALLPFEAWLGVVTGVPNPPLVYVALHTFISLFVLGALVVATVIVWRSASREEREPPEPGRPA